MKKTKIQHQTAPVSPAAAASGSARRIVTDAFLTAILFALQIALAYLPNIELVSLFVILYTRILGKRVLPILTAFTLLEGILYGFGIWWISYLYLWPFLAGCTWCLKKLNSPDWGYVILSSLYGLSFGFLCSLPYLSGGVGAMFSWWIAGIPFDLIHGISNLILALILLNPLQRILHKLYAEQSQTS